MPSNNTQKKSERHISKNSVLAAKKRPDAGLKRTADGDGGAGGTGADFTSPPPPMDPDRSALASLLSF